MEILKATESALQQEDIRNVQFMSIEASPYSNCSRVALEARTAEKSYSIDCRTDAAAKEFELTFKDKVTDENLLRITDPLDPMVLGFIRSCYEKDPKVASILATIAGRVVIHDFIEKLAIEDTAPFANTELLAFENESKSYIAAHDIARGSLFVICNKTEVSQDTGNHYNSLYATWALKIGDVTVRVCRHPESIAEVFTEFDCEDVQRIAPERYEAAYRNLAGLCQRAVDKLHA